MSEVRSWHDRPILSPLVCFTCTFLAGGLAFSCGYLLLGRIRHGWYTVLVIDGLMVLYLLASMRGGKRK
jgi:hypothetical protein